MFFTILKIRLKQIYRSGAGLGLFRSLFVVGLIVFLLIGFYSQFVKPGWEKWITAAYLLAILSIHLKRPDKGFLKINLENYQAILFFEYLLIAIPLLICQVYFQFYSLILMTILASIAIPFIRLSFERKGLNNFLISAIPSEAFEWKAGIRKYFIFMLAVWLMGMLASWYIAVVPVVIIILALAVINFYEYGEPLSILLSSELNPKAYLLRKIITAQSIISAILLPLILVFVIFHTELWFIPLVEYVIISFILWYIILLKYSFYQPNKQLIAGQIFSAIGAMSLFIPFLIPLLWMLSIRFYFKSIANLKPYLDDYN